MTYAAVGSIQSSSGSPVPSLNLTTTTIGNFVLAEVINTGTAIATALTSTNCTWSALGASFTGSVTAGTCQCFLGAVTGTGAATVSITWGSGTTASFSNLVAQEFSTTTGTPVLDKQGHVDSSGTSTWASLSPAGAGEAYFGSALNAGSATNGSTSGYTYGSDGSGNGVAHNAACTSSAQAPVWGDSGQQLGVMVLVAPAGGAPTAGPPSFSAPPSRVAVVAGFAGRVGAGHSQ